MAIEARVRASGFVLLNRPLSKSGMDKANVAVSPGIDFGDEGGG
ncbi:MAG: hypothetical protein ABIL58_21070 [Pseudomonadota bacterium]